MAGSTAGGSAAERARELRAKAARLEEQARQWEKGAEGERRTAAVLSGLAKDGYVVLDDLSIPGSKANIDHVVVGPTGVTVIETKAYTGRLDLRDGVLWHGKYPLRRELAAARFEADKVREVVASTGWPVMVRSVMCVHSDAVPAAPSRSLAPIELCSSLELLTRIQAAPGVLSPDHVRHLVQVIEGALPPRVTATSGARPPEPPTDRPIGLVVPLRQQRSHTRWHRYALRAARALDRVGRRVMAVMLAFIIIVIGLALIAAIASTAVNEIVPDTTATTTTSTLLTPSGAPAETPTG